MFLQMGLHGVLGLAAAVRRARVQPFAVERAADAAAAQLDGRQGRQDPQGARREDAEGLSDASEKEGRTQDHHELSGVEFLSSIQVIE